MSISPSIKKYKIDIEILSPTCCGGVGSGDDTKYASYEYFIESGRVYFINDCDILNLIELNIISQKDMDQDYTFILNKIKNNPKAKECLKSAKMTGRFENKIDLFKFSKSIEIGDKIQETPVIFGSTLKGILRTGYGAYKNSSFKYEFFRDKKKRLKLNSLNINNNICKSNNDIYKLSYRKDDYVQNIENISDFEDFNVNMIFKNIICSDLKMVKGDMVIEKISRINRKSKNSTKLKNSGIPMYFECPEKGSQFTGFVSYKTKCSNKTLLSLYSCKSKEGKTPVDECLMGLKNMSKNIINAERRILSGLSNKDVEDFYSELERINYDENTAAIKLGYSGILSKTYMAMDEFNLKNSEFLPYTINVSETTKLPAGWVKLRWEEIDEA